MADNDISFADVLGSQSQPQAQPAQAAPISFDDVLKPQAQPMSFDDVLKPPPVTPFNFMRPAPDEQKEVENAQAGYGVLPELAQAPEADPHMTNALDSSFKIGLYNKQVNDPATQQDVADHPVISAIGLGFGSLIKYGAIGASLNPVVASGEAVAGAGAEGISLMSSIKTAGAIGHAGATFGIGAALDGLSKSLQGGKLTAQDLLNVPEQTAIGAPFGATQALANPAARITAQGVYGYGMSKMQGGTDANSIVNGFVMTLFGLVNRGDLDVQNLHQAADKVSETLATKLNEAGMPMDQAAATTDHLMAGFRVEPNGTANEGLPKVTLDYFQNLNDKIKNSTFLRPAGLPGTDNLRTNMESDEPIPEPTPPKAPEGATISETGASGTEEKPALTPLTGQQQGLANNHFEKAIEGIKQANPNNSFFQALSLGALNGNGSQLRDRVLDAINKEREKPESNDQSIQDVIHKELGLVGRNDKYGRAPGTVDEYNQQHIISIPTNEKGLADSSKGIVFDERNMRSLTAGQMGEYLAQHNIDLENANKIALERDPNIIPYPLFEHKDLVARINRVPDQPAAREAQFRKSTLEAFDKAKNIKVEPPTLQPKEPPNPFIPLDVARKTQSLIDMFKSAQDKPKPFGMKVTPPPPEQTQVEKAVQQAINNLPKISTEKLEEKLHEDIKTIVAEKEIKDEVVKEFTESKAVEEIIIKQPSIEEQVARHMDQMQQEGKSEYLNPEEGRGESDILKLETDKVYDLLKEWKFSRSKQNLPQPSKPFVGKSMLDPRQTGVDGQTSLSVNPGQALTESDEKLKELQLREGASRYYDKPVDQLTEWHLKEYKKLQIKNWSLDKKSRERTLKMQQEVIAAHPIYDKYHLDEIKEAIDGMDDGQSKTILENAIARINALVGSTKEITSMKNGQLVKHAVYENLVPVPEITMAMNHISDAVKSPKESNDINWDNDSTVGGTIHDGDIRDPESGMAMNPVDIIKYVFTGKVGLVVSIDGTYKNPIVAALDAMRNSPTSSLEELIHLKMGTKDSKERAIFKKANNLGSGEEALESISSYKNFEQAVDSLIKGHLEALDKYIKEGIQEHYKAHPELLQGIVDRSISVYNKYHPLSPMRPMPGVKISDPAVLRLVQDMYMDLWKHAQEQVAPGKGPLWQQPVLTGLGNDQHMDPAEQHAYVEEAKMQNEMWGIPYDPVADVAKWQAHREPIFWNMLKDPRVMSNSSLQKAILWTQAFMINPVYGMAVKLGHFDNADVVKSTRTGFSPHGYTTSNNQASYEQKVNNWFSAGGATGTIKNPGAKLESQQSFNMNAAANNYLPISDGINDTYQYMRKQLLNIQKTLLMQELGKMPIPKLEYGITPIRNAKYVNLRECLKANPCPNPGFAMNIMHTASPWIQDESKRLTELMFTSAQIAEGLRIAKADKGNPFEISRQMLLNEMGHVQARQDEGFNMWHNGTWLPPYIYKPVKDILDTTLRSYPGFEALPGIQKAIQYAKIALVANPFFHVPQLVAESIMSQPLYKQPYYVAILAGQTVIHTFKYPGIAMKIWTGQYFHEVGDTEQDRNDAVEFMIHGSPITGNYMSIVKNIFDLQEKGIIRGRQSQGDNIIDFVLSCAGMGQVYLGEMVPRLLLPMMQSTRDSFIAKGYSREDAIKMTVALTTRNMNKLVKMSWTDSGVKSLLSILSISSDWTVSPMRNIVMTALSPLGSAAMGGVAGAAVGGPEHWLAGTIFGAMLTPSVVNRMKELGAFGYRSAVKGAAWTNTFTGADIPPRFREKMQADIFNSFMVWSALAWFTYALWQYASNPKQPFIWKNEYPEDVDTGDQDLNGHEIFWHSNFFRGQRDMMSLINPLTEKAIQNISHNPEFRTGLPGPMQVINNKLSGLNPLVETVTNKDWRGDMVWDKYSDDHIKILKDMGNHIIQGYAPIQGFSGSGEAQVQLGSKLDSSTITGRSKDNLKDFFYKTLASSGTTFRTGGDAKLDADKRKVAEAAFWKQKNLDLKTEDGITDALNKNYITNSAAKEAYKRLTTTSDRYEKTNKRAINFDDVLQSASK